jgi:AbrB family looped-hinge helix DNA binding protein
VGGGILLIYKSSILVDDKGRVTIPQKVREQMGLGRGSILVLEYHADQTIKLEGVLKNEN